MASTSHTDSIVLRSITESNRVKLSVSGSVILSDRCADIRTLHKPNFSDSLPLRHRPKGSMPKRNEESAPWTQACASPPHSRRVAVSSPMSLCGHADRCRRSVGASRARLDFRKRVFAARQSVPPQKKNAAGLFPNGSTFLLSPETGPAAVVCVYVCVCVCVCV